MPLPGHLRIHALGPADVALMGSLSTMFGEAFEDPESYGKSRPDRAYTERLLGGECFLALAALDGASVVGGLAAYVLQKFERERSEIYIYDLAVAPNYRRMGIATALIRALRTITKNRGAHVVFVQADIGDAPAISLYTKLGVREEVLHFDIAVEGSDSDA